MQNDNTVLFEVTSMFRSLLKSISQEWNKRGSALSLPQFKVLYVLSKDGPQMVSQVAHALSITSAAVIGLTDKLLAEGYVRKERAEKDRRVVYISNTAKGAEAVQEIQKDQSEAITSVFKMLPEEDVQHLRRIFGTMLAQLEK
ncbi:MarR family winged helix-turn-helix transcriptional regulator [Paenibacillus sp. J22TS3]|uniref:MarR family winged helix-turn-helix transcriptional regulator n=1 Tax=Paenibacillus sp. J22TS3 TaxID=2807192 RepID=UPI001B109364|nr:MarR family transcriptional regulator [Paenibacillus sp. J22TS3]GIP22106.1 MarR family transcriptional regulator [Paenibacillus sp. J22TS3]